MNWLLDTHLLLWAAGLPDRLPLRLRVLLNDETEQPVYSAVSLWEVTIKGSLGRSDFVVNPHVLRRGLIDNGWVELPVTGVHAVAVGHLPPIHRDPFDRMLVAQAASEGITLLTSDATVARYPGPVELI